VTPRRPSADAGAGPAAPRRPGRPRDPEADARILRAALELAAVDGLRGLRMEAVAARAGVGKATVYRRWSSKEELLTDAVRAVARDIDAPDLGSVREDYLALTRQAAATLSAKAGRLMPQLMLGSADDPDLYRLCRRVLVDPRRAALRAVLARGVARGELRADLDLDLAIDLLIGPIVYRALISGGYGRAVAGRPAAVVDAVLAGIAAR
jgi:AcrR family transcriptional regulator